MVVEDHDRREISRLGTITYVGLGTRDQKELSNVAEIYKGTMAANMATVLVGDYRLNNGCAQVFNNKTIGENDLTKAMRSYETIGPEKRETRCCSPGPNSALGRANESKCELEAAEKCYSEVVTAWPDSAYAMMAAERLNDPEADGHEKVLRRFSGPITKRLPVPRRRFRYPEGNARLRREQHALGRIATICPTPIRKTPRWPRRKAPRRNRKLHRRNRNSKLSGSHAPHGNPLSETLRVRSSRGRNDVYPSPHGTRSIPGSAFPSRAWERGKPVFQ